MGEFVQAHPVIAVGRQRDIGQCVVAGVVAVEHQPAAGSVVQLHGWLRLAVDARSRHVQQHALPLLAGEGEVIDIGRRIDRTIDHGIDRDLLRGADVVVRLLLLDFGKIAHGEGPRIAHAPFIDEADVVAADRHVRGDAHLELRHHARASRHALTRRRHRRCRLLRFRRFRRHDRLGLQARMAENQALWFVHVGAGEGHLHRAARLRPAGKDGRQARLRQWRQVLLGQRGSRQRQQRAE